MSSSSFAIPDPDLARRTRVGHWTLFVINTILLFPAVFAAMVMREFAEESSTIESLLRQLEILVFSMPAISGVLAWAALGLLLTKPAFPRWHLGSWGFVLFFGLWCIPARLYMMRNLGGTPLYFGLSAFLILLGVAASWIAIRNLRLAWISLRRHRPACP